MGYVQVRLKYPDVSQPALKTDSDESVKNYANLQGMPLKVTIKLAWFGLVASASRAVPVMLA
jgi:hypothetical protein